MVGRGGSGREGKGYMLAKDFMLQYVNVVAGGLSNLICLNGSGMHCLMPRLGHMSSCDVSQKWYEKYI